MLAEHRVQEHQPHGRRVLGPGCQVGDDTGPYPLGERCRG
ncbi:hypothetical protein GA0115255_117831, partial [Streptomyces sp. Ncost-T6T-2b]